LKDERRQHERWVLPLFRVSVVVRSSLAQKCRFLEIRMPTLATSIKKNYMHIANLNTRSHVHNGG
jgi:hypothetical protein